MTTAACNEEDVSKLWIGYPLLRTSATSFVGGAMMTQVLPCPYWHGTDLASSSIGMSSECKSEMKSTALKHLRPIVCTRLSRRPSATPPAW